MFDTKFFQVLLDRRPIIASNARVEAEIVMGGKADACDETVVRKDYTNRHKCQCISGMKNCRNVSTMYFCEENC